MAADWTREEVRQVILRFLDDDGGQWDWDDFTSVRIKDPLLDAVRGVCVEVHDAYPEAGRYCSEQGMTLMRAIAEAL